VKPKKAVIYVRVSTKEQAMNNMSLDTQEADARRECERRGWEVAEVYREEGVSARTLNRPELMRALTACESKKAGIDVLVVAYLDRLSRESHGYHTIRARLGAGGIMLHAVHQPVDDSPMGKAMQTIAVAFAELDNDMRGVRTKAGMRTAVEAGRWVHQPPLGYRKPVGGKEAPSLEPDPDVAPLVRMAFERMATGRARQTEVLSLVTAAGLRTKKGKPLALERLRTMLHNPIYKGLVVSTVNDLRVRGDFDPIVSEETFECVQSVLKGRGCRKAPRRGVRPDFPLKSVLRCGECNKPLTAAFSAGNGGTYGYYRCRDNHVKAPYENVHKAFVTRLEGMQPEPGLMRLFRAIVKDVWRSRHEDARLVRATLQAEVDKLRARKDGLCDRYLDNRIDDATYQEQHDRHQIAIGEARLRLADAQEDELDVEGVLDYAEYALRNAARLWEGFKAEQRVAFQHLLFPNGLPFDGEKFGTTEISPVFKMLEPATRAGSGLASLAGFEPC
jgi:DNA invertase Pin-like site-specific DNA recombinase